VTRIWPFRHFGLKVISVGLALLLWLVVAGEETVERSLRVPLELQQFPNGLELAGDLPPSVDVRLRGTGGALGRVGPGDVVAVLDLRTARAGRRLFHIESEQVRVPFGVQVVQVTPSTVAVTFEASAVREVRVVPDLEGKPAPGYVVGKASSDPATIEIVGPESAVKHVTEALTEPISIAGASEAVTEVVNVGLSEPAVRLRTPRPATVTVDIVPAPVERMLGHRPVHLRNLTATLAAAAEPASVDIGVRGSREALAHVDPDEVVAFVDLAGLGVGEYVLNVHVDSSKEAGVTRIDPAAIKVRISSAK